MRVVVGFVVVGFLAVAASAAAHSYSVSGTVASPYGDPLHTGIFAVVESLAPGTLPHGVFWYVIEAEGGDTFSLLAHERTYIEGIRLVNFDVHFAGAECNGPGDGTCHENGPGDESGLVPFGAAGGVVTLVWGPTFSGFTYAEA